MEEEEAMAVCSQAVNPIIDAEIKCSHCGSGFVEEMGEEIESGRRFRRTEFGVDNDEVNIADADVDGNDIADNRRRRHRDREHDREIELDRELDSITRSRRRSVDSILQLLRGIREGTNSDEELDHLLRSLADNDQIRREGTLPARKEAVGNLPTVKDLEKGSEAKEMPCKHKFHIQCIVPWLELHNSCPVCRYVLRPDEELQTNLLRPRTRSVGIINLSNENVEDDARNNSISHGTI
uniref:RING-type E3 ubiquitin transferase n=2 Tax=Brassica oleracea TaxID=3712 RepID=A0A0D3BB87_BRAOL|nr:unnamed protein product [Brassica oleracea]